jgi:hypothetical protein|tara:strand:+ start:8824 stop:9558 length:735 start_codon:yes stop_codon:yes gene_type:complete
MAFSRIRLEGIVSSTSDFKQPLVELSRTVLDATPTAWVHNTLNVPAGSSGSPGVSYDLQANPDDAQSGTLGMTAVHSIVIKNNGAGALGFEYWTLLETIGPGSFEITANELRDKLANDAFVNCHVGNFLLVENADEAANNRLVLISQHHGDFPDHIVLAQHYLGAFVADGGDTNVTFKRLQRNEFTLASGASMVIPGELFPISSTTFASTAAAPGSLFQTEQHELQLWGMGIEAVNVELLVMGV